MRSLLVRSHKYSLETSTRNHRIPHRLINRRFAAIKKFSSFFFLLKERIVFYLFCLITSVPPQKKETNQDGRFFLTFFEVIFLNIIQRSRRINGSRSSCKIIYSILSESIIYKEAKDCRNFYSRVRTMIAGKAKLEFIEFNNIPRFHL